MRCFFLPLAPVLLVASVACHAQCPENRFISDSGQQDCQPLETLTQLTPEQMTPAARAIVASRHDELVQAARFHGFDLNAAGWTYRQSVSPILRKHIIVAFVQNQNIDRMVAVLPVEVSERVQIVPSVARGLRLFDPGWQKNGTYSVYNRLLRSERGEGPVDEDAEWVQLASLYIALAGREVAVPTTSGSVKAGWDLAARRASTPVIEVRKNGGAVITVSDLSQPDKTVRWTLSFDRLGQIRRVERQGFKPEKIRTMATKIDPGSASLPKASPLNP